MVSLFLFFFLYFFLFFLSLHVLLYALTKKGGFKGVCEVDVTTISKNGMNLFFSPSSPPILATSLLFAEKETSVSFFSRTAKTPTIPDERHFP